MQLTPASQFTPEAVLGTFVSYSALGGGGDFEVAGSALESRLPAVKRSSGRFPSGEVLFVSFSFPGCVGGLKEEEQAKRC